MHGRVPLQISYSQVSVLNVAHILLLYLPRKDPLCNLHSRPALQYIVILGQSLVWSSEEVFQSWQSNASFAILYYTNLDLSCKKQLVARTSPDDYNTIKIPQKARGGQRSVMRFLFGKLRIPERQQVAIRVGFLTLEI